MRLLFGMDIVLDGRNHNYVSLHLNNMGPHTGHLGSSLLSQAS